MNNILKKLALSLAIGSVPAMAANISVNIGGPGYARPGYVPARPGFGRPGFGRPGFGRQLTCSAQNRRGQIFTAVGLNQNNVQARAIAQCSSVSRFSCRPIGCR